MEELGALRHQPELTETKAPAHRKNKIPVESLGFAVPLQKSVSVVC